MKKVEMIRKEIRKIVKEEMKEKTKEIVEEIVEEIVGKAEFIDERVRLLPQTPYRLSPSRSTPALSFWYTSFLPF